jgi:hypothetical protein
MRHRIAFRLEFGKVIEDELETIDLARDLAEKPRWKRLAVTCNKVRSDAVVDRP